MKKEQMSLETRGFVWNTLAGLINAAEAVVILMVVTRTCEIEDAGIITIAFSVGNLTMTIGKYGMRNFQVTDIQNRCSLNDYFTSRIITVFLMFIAVIAYLIYATGGLDYSLRKSMIVFLICAIYMVEALEDVFCGNYQKQGRLDYAGQVFAYRWLLQLLVIICLLFMKVDIVWSLLTAFCLGTVFTIIFNIIKFPFYSEQKLAFSLHNTKFLLKCCFPLFLTGFLSNYITNSPKYAIDAMLGEQEQAYYGFIAMPVFVIALFSNFFYQPVLVNLAAFWQERKITDMKRLIWQQMFLIVILTLICLGGAYFLGIPVLSRLFNADLTDYKNSLLIMLLGGGFLAYDALLMVIMTTMRIQQQAIYVYCIIAATAFVFSRKIICEYGISGAAWLYTFLELILSVVLLLITWFKLQKTSKLFQLQ